MRILMLFFLLITCAAQAQNDYDMDEIARNVPSSKTTSVDQLATYFVKTIPEERGRIRAIFAWITLNIRYLDTSRESELWATPEHLDRQRPEQVLKNRTAVCQGFANLFQALANASGMESQVVTGIVKNEDREVMRVGHAWVAARVLDEWRLFDPTWSLPPPGAQWNVNDKYFMVAPARFVLNHLPDDPVWQLLQNPLREDDFRDNQDADIFRLLQREQDPIFDFRDTLKDWITMDSMTRIFSAESRILQFNTHNQRVLFGLGQNYWSAFFDLRAQLDSLADRSILEDSILIDTFYFSEQLDLMNKYHQRARALFSEMTDPRRIAQAEKFYTAEEVAAIIAKLRGAMRTAAFENLYLLATHQINEGTLSDLKAISDAADDAYSFALQTIDCRKGQNTCFEIWHNRSLAHLQLAERYSIFSQHLLADKNAARNLPAINAAIKNSENLYKQSEEEVRQLMLIPPPYAFVKERLRNVRQGLLSVRMNDIRARRTAIGTQLETALSASNKNTSSAKNMLAKLEPIIDDLAALAETIEDGYGAALSTEYCDAALFNLNQEGFAMQFNLGSLYFRSALDMYQNAVEHNTLNEDIKRIQQQAQKALPCIRAANQSLDFLEKSNRAPASYVEQRSVQMTQLSKSIHSFLNTL